MASSDPAKRERMGLAGKDTPDTLDSAWERVLSSSREPRHRGDAYVCAGEIVAGKYRVERILGVGGMAFVLSAVHVDLLERFALKFLNKELLRRAGTIERFTREARAACRIRNEHVARVHDVGTHEGVPFLVMEHLEGRDLGTILGETGALRVDDAVEYTMQACEALAAAHAHGIVHRDIKPENLFLVEHEGLPSIKLLDFGISKVALTDDGRSNLTGRLTLGTPRYMAPEQIRSTASADARSDLWSLGVVLYELLAGTEAFRADDAAEVCAAVLEQEPVPLLELCPTIPEGLADVVARCMRKDPAQRFANVAELAVALLPFAPTRALVSAERSSSLMRLACRADSGEQSVPSSRPRFSPYPSGDLRVSSVPVPRSLEPSVDAGVRSSVPGETFTAKGGWIVLAAAMLATLALSGFLSYRARSGSGSVRGEAAPTSVATRLEEPAPVEASAAACTIQARDGGTKAEAAVSVPPVQRRVLAPATDAAPRLSLPRAPAPRPSPSAPATNSAPARTTVVAPPAVELGY
jgi:serine/threonine-protein kinase